MHVAKVNINGNPNVGLFGYTTAKQGLIGVKLRTKQRKEFEEVLDVPLARTTIAGTDLVGVFLAGNKRTTLVPAIAFDHERAALEKAGIEFTLFETKQTCLGNAIACNDKGAIISTDFSEAEAAFIGIALGVPVLQMNVAGLTTPGALIVVNGAHAAVHKDASPEEVKKIEKILGVTVSPATVNLGSPHLHAGILRSAHGFLVGDLSGGPEIVNLDDALGYHTLE